MEKREKNASKFVCDNCDFNCSKNCDWMRHISTAKHKNRTKLNDFAPKSAEEMFACNRCNKKYKARNSLWYHQKKCTETKLYDETDK